MIRNDKVAELLEQRRAMDLKQLNQVNPICCVSHIVCVCVCVCACVCALYGCFVCWVMPTCHVRCNGTVSLAPELGAPLWCCTGPTVTPTACVFHFWLQCPVTHQKSLAEEPTQCKLAQIVLFYCVLCWTVLHSRPVLVCIIAVVVSCHKKFSCWFSSPGPKTAMRLPNQFRFTEPVLPF